MEWFRLYNEFRADAKLVSFTKAQRYDFLSLLCLASESQERGTIHLEDEDLAATLGLSDDEWRAFRTKLERKNMVHGENGSLVITNWQTRQKASDSSLERVKRYRERNKPVTETEVKRDCNVTVTERTEQIDREEKKERAEGVPAATAAARSRFVKPSEVEFAAYFKEKGSTGKEARKAWDYYESKGWLVGKVPMKDWKAAVRGWIERAGEFGNGHSPADRSDADVTAEAGYQRAQAIIAERSRGTEEAVPMPEEVKKMLGGILGRQMP